MLIQSVRTTLSEVDNFLSQLTHEQYNRRCAQLNESTIGQHTRHIIELFDCLITHYEHGVINYDSRPRNNLIETLPDYAQTCIQKILGNINKPDKSLLLSQKIAGKEMRIQTNYFRELLYNLEHCIHHQALIRVAVFEMNNVHIDANFGVAPATVEFKKQCAQ